MNLADINTIKKFMNSDGFSFKKSLGQNFLINPSVCPKMAESAADKQTGVIEIGPGIGVLTYELSKVAGKVVAIELDRSLERVLNKTLCGCNNVEVIFGDAMKMDLSALISEKLSNFSRIAVCANLPYYITSPIITMLLESRLPIDNITVMVQKEAAERICAKVGSRESGALTAAVNYYSQSEILFGVGKDSFMPPPKVDSAVIQLKIRKEPPVKIDNEKFFFRFVKACFAQRRKTFINTVSNTMHIEKGILRETLCALSIEETIRSEQLSMDQLAQISNILCNK